MVRNRSTHTTEEIFMKKQNNKKSTVNILSQVLNLFKDTGTLPGMLWPPFSLLMSPFFSGSFWDNQQVQFLFRLNFGEAFLLGLRSWIILSASSSTLLCYKTEPVLLMMVPAHVWLPVFRNSAPVKVAIAKVLSCSPFLWSLSLVLLFLARQL